MLDTRELIKAGIAAVSEAADALERTLVLSTVDLKSDGSLVTDVDLAIQSIVMQSLSRSTPSVSVLSEESFPICASNPNNFTGWVLDPIDGTTNFSRGQTIYCVSLGLLEGGHPVGGIIWDAHSKEVTYRVAPASEITRNLSDAFVGLDYEGPLEAVSWGTEQFAWLAPRCRSVRVLGSVALGMLWVAKGLLDVYLAPRPRLWDYAAGWYLVESSDRVVRFVDRGMDCPSMICGSANLVNTWLTTGPGSKSE